MRSSKKKREAMERKYEVILTFTLHNQQEVYSNLDIELYTTLRKRDGFVKFLFDKHQNGFGLTPISVSADIYLDAKIMDMPTPMGKEMIVVGKKLISLDFFQ